MLRKGKTKNILESSIDSALLAVEIYNKPRAPFRVQNYISLMIIAWTKLFHSYFNHTIGDIYYYKQKNSPRYEIIDGERKAWEVKTCIKKYKELSEPVKANLDFFIKLRNKIEHRYITSEDIGANIFGECQSLLYNYESHLTKLFGDEYVLNENLAFSLQFSKIKTDEQKMASKKLLSREVKEVNKFIGKYRSSLKDEVFNSQDYSIKLIQIPKITNNSKKNVLAIEFVNWSDLSEEDKKSYDKLNAIIKDKIIKTEVINPGKLKPGKILRLVNSKVEISFNHHDHKCIYYMFSIRPIKSEKLDPFKTNTKYCHYDEAHNDYLFKEEWANLLVKIITNKKLKRKNWREAFNNKQKYDITEYE